MRSSNIQSLSSYRPIIVLIIFDVAGAIVGGTKAVNQAREAAARSYLLSVCNAVQEYRIEHGSYPDRLAQIDTSKFDYNGGVTLDSLDYELGASEFRVSFPRHSNDALSCSHKLLPD